MNIASDARAVCEAGDLAPAHTLSIVWQATGGAGTLPACGRVTLLQLQANLTDPPLALPAVGGVVSVPPGDGGGPGFLSVWLQEPDGGLSALIGTFFPTCSAP